MKKIIVALQFMYLLVCIESQSLYAQTDSLRAISTSANVDLMSRYIWRGQEYGQAPSIQPAMSATWKNFTIGAWGAYKLTGAGGQETDFYLSKTVGHLTFAIWDYWSFCDTTSTDFFNYNQKNTAHLLEAQILVSGGEKIPFNLLGSYLFYGADPSKSIYLELQYQHSVGSTELQFFSGFQAKGEYYGHNSTFVNLGCTMIKTIEATDRWSLPVSLSVIVNPSQKSAYLVAGITL